MTALKKPVNYLNNRDLLKEIHASKNTYCTYLNPEDHRYDLIVDFPTHPIEHSFEYLASNSEVILEAKKTRAARIELETGESLDPELIPITDLVFRIMTWEHIPVAPKAKKIVKKKTARDILDIENVVVEDEVFGELDDIIPSQDIDDMIHVRVNFPPFQHYKINEHGSLVCVGKSHWTGDLKSGQFSKDHGQITNKLAKMYMMICEKYAMKYNWRSYTYLDEMRSSAILQLTYVGLRFNEVKSNNPFAYYTAAITNSFCRVLNTEKRNQNIRDDLLELNGLNPSWTRSNSSSESYEE